MRSLSVHDIMRLCEWGRDKHSLDRAIALLRAILPESSPDALARLPIGRRDGLLLELRARLFGPAFELLAPCLECGERLSLEFTLDALRLPPPASIRGVIEREGLCVRYRLPDSLDLAAVVGIPEPEVARARMLERCVLEARSEAGEVSLQEMPQAVVDALVAQMAEDDPQADVTFRLRCLRCEHSWRAAFDIVSFLWAELEATARQLQREVHALAQAYGWTEANILSLSSHSRKSYLEMIGGA